MTLENAKAFLPIVQAMAEGKKIRHKNCFGEWTQLLPGVNLKMQRDPADYEIAREPRVVWVNEYEQADKTLAGYAYTTKERAEQCASTPRITCRKFVEVIED